MEKFVAGFAVLGALLAANVSMSEAQTEKRYFKAGGGVTLSPAAVSDPITSIVWKYDKNLLAEWAKDSISLTYYSKFKGRSKLDTTTGVLLIQKMTAEDTGHYSVEINYRVQSLGYQTVEIEEVPQPTVEVQPLTCNLPQICGLKCHGDVAKAEPVQYFWKNDDGEWKSSGDRRNLTKEEMMNVTNFYCRLTNPVSQKDSEPFKNPFSEKAPTPEGSPVGGIVGGIIGVVALVGAVLIGLGVWKKDELKKCLTSDPNPESCPKDDKEKAEGLLHGNNESNNPGKSPSNGDNNELSDVTTSKCP